MEYKVMYKMPGSSIWHIEEFVDEKQAMKCAECQRDAGAANIEVYKKGRIGYIQIKKF